MKHKKQKKSTHKDSSSESSSSSDSSSDENPPRHHKKQSRKDEKHSKHSEEKSNKRSRHSRSPTDERKKRTETQRHSEKHDRERERSDKRRERNSHAAKSSRRDKERRDDSPPVKVKKEEDFDRRQNELSRRRRGERRPDIQIKQEPNSDDERRRRNDRHRGRRGEDSRGHRDRQREDVERERRANDARRAEAWQQREQEGGGNAEALAAETEEPIEKEKPNLGLSGALTEDTNTFRGVVIKYSEPPEARVPKKKWRLYPFKGDEALKVLHLHRQSAYLLGRLRRIADIPIDHPSCSKQHAVFQFRLVDEKRDDGSTRRIVKPYIIDLDSGNGTFVNNQQIDPRRYVELKEKDVVKFGFSSREYVLIHDKSDTTEVEGSGSESSGSSD